MDVFELLRVPGKAGIDLNHYGICEVDIFGTLGRIRINLINDGEDK